MQQLKTFRLDLKLYDAKKELTKQVSSIGRATTTTNKKLQQLKNQNFLPTEETRKSFRQTKSNKSIHQKTRKNFQLVMAIVKL